MKIKDIIYNTPEISEEKLLEIINNELDFLKRINKSLINRILNIHNYSEPINKLLLKEYDLIQDKKSFLTKSQRDLVIGFVGACMIKIVKNDGGTTESTSPDGLEFVPKAEEIRDNSE